MADLDLAAFADAFRHLSAAVMSSTPQTSTPLADALRAHLGDAFADAPVLAQTFPAFEHVNVQLALDAWTDGKEVQRLGVGQQGRHHSLAELLAFAVEPWARLGPVDLVNLPSGPDGATMPCLSFGMLLVRDGDEQLLMLVRGPEHPGAPLALELTGVDSTRAGQIFADLRALAHQHNVFRGHVLSLSHQGVSFHALEIVDRADIVLLPGVLERVERPVLGIAAQRERLRAAGRHLRRGVLLFGPPGTGKTLTVRYLSQRLTDHTVLLLSGESLSLIGESCAMARALSPSVVVVEDVDLIAEERTMPGGGHNPLLFQLLNEMDGMEEDSDVVFLLTTNRADLLEPALAARPGRIDQAVEIGLPDAAGLRRLLTLYGRGLRLEVEDLDAIVQRLEGVTASFVKELLRKAALLAAEESPGEIVVADRHLASAVDEMLIEGSVLTRLLLGEGGEAPRPAEPGLAPHPGIGSPFPMAYASSVRYVRHG